VDLRGDEGKRITSARWPTAYRELMAGRARPISFLVVAVAIAAAGGLALVWGGRPAASPVPAEGPSGGQPRGSAGSSARAQGRPTAGSIAVIEPSGSLSVVDSSGRSVVLSDGTGVAFGFPAWSPDGSRIAAVAGGANETSISVYEVRPGATDPSPRSAVIFRSATARPFYLYWAPDGRSLAFLATEADGLSLRIVPADGSAPLDGSGPGAVIRRGEPLYYEWIGADRLLLHVGAGSDAFLGEVGLDGVADAPAFARPGVFRSAALSANRQYLAYVRAGRGGPDDVVVAMRDGSGEHTLTVFGIAAVVFNPAGDTLASIGFDRPGRTDPAFPIGPLRLIDARSGATRTVLDGLVVGFFWSPDGRTIAALRLQAGGGSTAISRPVLAAAAVSSPSAVSSPTPAPSAEPTEVRIVFVDVATGAIRSQRVVQPGRRFVNEVLPYFDQYAHSHRLWAPDSSAILMPLVDAAGRTELVALRPDGGDDPLTIDGEAGFWSP
jgi:TolB protein